MCSLSDNSLRLCFMCYSVYIYVLLKLKKKLKNTQVLQCGFLISSAGKVCVEMENPV